MISAVRLCVCLLSVCTWECDIFITNIEQILTPVSTSCPWSKGMKWSILGSGDQTPRSYDAEDRFGGLAEASSSTHSLNPLESSEFSSFWDDTVYICILQSRDSCVKLEETCFIKRSPSCMCGCVDSGFSIDQRTVSAFIGHDIKDFCHVNDIDQLLRHLSEGYWHIPSISVFISYRVAHKKVDHFVSVTYLQYRKCYPLLQ